ncbi:recombinase family protein [Erysipelothrix sp. HDW6A]|uniref:recombinase family protein n=1 Tax=Erysipelothrix sp. HDW6A TaxID=2714928 RepID=UPI00140DE82F|nr:recombinase family protein [Erysipelothrix sp. HDW6A]QIK57028.1 recombinase family protein [Erysipelothrix sp. HDW6A]
MNYKTLIERLQDHPGIKPCIYARVSTQKQLNAGFSLQSQIDRSKQSLEWYGINPVSEIVIYSDGAKSGSDTKRNDLQQMKKDIESGIVNLVIVTVTDRVGRDVIDNMEFRKFIIKCNSEMLFINNPSLDIYTLEGGFQYGLDSLIGWRELNSTRQRAVAGIIKSFENGNYANPRCPYGYRKVKNKNKKGFKIYIDTKQADVVKLIHKLYLKDSYNVEQVASYLRINKIDEGRVWNDDIVRKILRNTVYCDIIVREDLGRTFAGIGIAPVIISIETKKKVLELLQRRSRSHRNDNKHIFYMQVVCINCNALCTNDTVKNRKYRYYQCKKCKSRYSEVQLEEEVSEFLIDKVVSEKNREEHEKMKRQLKKYASQLKSAYSLYMGGDIIKRHYHNERMRIRREKKDYLKKLWERTTTDYYWFSLSIKQKQREAQRHIKKIYVNMRTKEVVRILPK